MRGNTLQILAELSREEKWICKSSNGVSVYNYYHASNTTLVEQDNFCVFWDFLVCIFLPIDLDLQGREFFFFLMPHKEKESLNIKPDRKLFLSKYSSYGCLENAVQILSLLCSYKLWEIHRFVHMAKAVSSLAIMPGGCCLQDRSTAVSPSSRPIRIRCWSWI